jgi:hypothetical protein
MEEYNRYFNCGANDLRIAQCLGRPESRISATVTPLLGARPSGRDERGLTDVDYSVHRDPHWKSADEGHANSHRKIKAGASAIGFALGIGE